MAPSTSISSGSSKNIYSSIKFHKRTPSKTSASSSKNSDNEGTGTTSRLRASRNAQATAFRKRSDYRSRAFSTAALANSKVRTLREKARHTSSGIAKPRYRRSKRSAFCREIKRLVQDDTTMNTRTAYDMAVLARETLHEFSKKLSDTKEIEELGAPLLEMMAYFESPAYRPSARVESTKIDFQRDFECLRRVLGQVEVLTYN